MAHLSHEPHNSPSWVVEDSEPEREQVRKQERRERRNARKAASKLAEGSQPRSIHEVSIDSSGSSSQDTGASSSKVKQRLNLKCYAYPSIHREIDHTNLPSRSFSHPRSQTTLPPFASAFGATELEKLVRCVACDLKWTVKKTVSQKLSHITSCAKKKDIPDTVLTTLLHKDLAQSSSENMYHVAPATLLEGIVEKTSTKRKRRLEAPSENLKNLEIIGDAIRSKARAVLQGGSIPPLSKALENHAIPSNARKEDSVEDMKGEDWVPATQPFGQSSLQQRFLSSTRLAMEDTDVEERGTGTTLNAICEQGEGSSTSANHDCVRNALTLRQENELNVSNHHNAPGSEQYNRSNSPYTLDDITDGVNNLQLDALSHADKKASRVKLHTRKGQPSLDAEAARTGDLCPPTRRKCLTSTTLPTVDLPISLTTAASSAGRSSDSEPHVKREKDRKIEGQSAALRKGKGKSKASDRDSDDGTVKALHIKPRTQRRKRKPGVADESDGSSQPSYSSL